MPNSYVMCMLEQGVAHTKGYIEESSAKVGNTVDLAGEIGSWEIIAVYDDVVDDEKLKEIQEKAHQSYYSVACQVPTKL